MNVRFVKQKRNCCFNKNDIKKIACKRNKTLMKQRIENNKQIEIKKKKNIKNRHCRVSGIEIAVK